MMYNSPCVLAHPQRPWGSPQCITVNTEPRGVAARGVSLCKSAHAQEHHLTGIAQIHSVSERLHANTVHHHTPYTAIHVHKHAPLHPHRTVAFARINIKASAWMSLAVTGSLWYERDPIDPHPTRPSSSKGHHSITIDPVCVCVMERD